MKQTNVVWELFKVLIAILLGMFIWVWIIATLPGEGSVDDKEFFPGAICVLGIATGFIATMILKFNALQQARQHIKAAASDIQIHEEKAERLLDKANRVADKYMNYEERVQLGITQRRSDTQRRNIRSAHQFQALLENYPDLKANGSIMELLRQIQECENSILYQKVAYNRAVERYNTMIYSFPGNLIRMVGRLKEADFYTKTLEAELISDEELGI